MATASNDENSIGIEPNIAKAKSSWSEFCKTLESVGNTALENLVDPNELELAEGVRYLTRIVGLSFDSQMENADADHPHFSRNIGPNRKMGGDNPQGHYLKAPINGEDTFRITGKRGSAAWISFQAMRNSECFSESLNVFGGCQFGTDLVTNDDGSFEIIASPKKTRNCKNWIETDKFCQTLVVRQFFRAFDIDMINMSIENLDKLDQAKQSLSVESILARLEETQGMFALMVPFFQGMVKGFKKSGINYFPNTDWSDSGGVPGGDPVNGVWQLEADETLIVTLKPPAECPYWDIQVGNNWYETFDYRYFVTGMADAQTHTNDDGSVTMIVSENDPGTVNWLQTAGHRQGHLAVRWHLIDGPPPVPSCKVVKFRDIQESIGHLPPVDVEAREKYLKTQRAAVDKRYRL